MLYDAHLWGASQMGSSHLKVEESSRVVPAPSWLGKRVGRFKLMAVLGQGAMGRVFRAEDTYIQRQVALKILPKSIKRGRRNIDGGTLIREARAAAALEHAHAVQVYEVNEASGVYYIAMELVDGGSLRDLVRGAGPLDVLRACQLAAEAAEALAHGHSLGIVHRDVKPGNLMLTRAGRCKVVDFGLARVDDPRDLGGLISESVGTPQFVAPEILTGTPASPQSDIYSLGGTLWYLLTGKPPFTSKNSQELLRQHMESPLPDLKAIRPDVPESLVKALNIALAKSPGDRFASMEQFAKVLRLHTIPIATGAPDLNDMILPAAQVAPAPVKRRAAERRIAERRTLDLTARLKWPWIAGAAAVVVVLGIALAVLLRPGTNSSSSSVPASSPARPAAATITAAVAAPLRPAPQPQPQPQRAVDPAAASLAAQWVADDYESGSNWVDRVHKIVAVQKNLPSAVPNAFNGHQGVLLNGRDQYFTLSTADYPLSNPSAMTLVAVFKPTAEGAKTGGAAAGFWQTSGLIGNEQPGIVGDWGLGWGGTSGRSLAAGLGDCPPGKEDTLQSDDLELNETYVAAMTFQQSGGPDGAGVLTLYVDGFAVAQDVNPAGPRRTSDSIALGAMTSKGDHPFPGMLAELRMYNAADVDVVSLSNALLKMYSKPGANSADKIGHIDLLHPHGR